MKSILIFVIGVIVGSAYPDVWQDVTSLFVESGARDSIVETLENWKTVK
jgi:hypothetical protein